MITPPLQPSPGGIQPAQPDAYAQHIIHQAHAAQAVQSPQPVQHIQQVQPAQAIQNAQQSQLARASHIPQPVRNARHAQPARVSRRPQPAGHAQPAQPAQGPRNAPAAQNTPAIQRSQSVQSARPTETTQQMPLTPAMQAYMDPELSTNYSRFIAGTMRARVTSIYNGTKYTGPSLDGPASAGQQPVVLTPEDEVLKVDLEFFFEIEAYACNMLRRDGARPLYSVEDMVLVYESLVGETGMLRGWGAHRQDHAHMCFTNQLARWRDFRRWQRCARSNTDYGEKGHYTPYRTILKDWKYRHSKMQDQYRNSLSKLPALLLNLATTYYEDQRADFRLKAHLSYVREVPEVKEVKQGRNGKKGRDGLSDFFYLHEDRLTNRLAQRGIWRMLELTGDPFKQGMLTTWLEYVDYECWWSEFYQRINYLRVMNSAEAHMDVDNNTRRVAAAKAHIRGVEAEEILKKQWDEIRMLNAQYHKAGSCNAPGSKGKEREGECCGASCKYLQKVHPSELAASRIGEVNDSPAVKAAAERRKKKEQRRKWMNMVLT